MKHIQTHGAVERQLLCKVRSISRAVGDQDWARLGGQKTLDMWANCVLKHRLPIKSFIPNFVAFFVLLVIALSCIRKMSSTVTSAKREFTRAIVSLSTSGEVDIALAYTNSVTLVFQAIWLVRYLWLMDNVHLPEVNNESMADVLKLPFVSPVNVIPTAVKETGY